MRDIITRPCGVIHLRRDKMEKSIFYACGKDKEGEIIPDLCGQLNEEYGFLVLAFDFASDDDGKTFLLYSTNQNAVGVRTGELFHEEELIRIARFQLTSEHRGALKYEDYALLLEFSTDYDRLSILFYDGLGNHASNLLLTWELGLLEDRVA